MIRVAGAEHPLPPLDLPLVRGRRVQRGLEAAVQVLRAAGALPGGGEHLDLIRRDMHMIRQPGPAQLHHRGEGPLTVPAAEKEEVPLVVGQQGGLSQVHRVGIADDGGLLRLAEHLPQEHRLHPPAADQVGKHVSRPHGGQLVRILLPAPAAYRAAGPAAERRRASDPPCSSHPRSPHPPPGAPAPSSSGRSPAGRTRSRSSPAAGGWSVPPCR